MIVLTGDTHRDFERISDFCEVWGTTRDDTLIILGDASINYYLDETDAALKAELSKLPITLFCIHGNHEERPFNTDRDYETELWHGGLVYMERRYPSLLFAMDGEIYELGGKTAVVLGGAYSVDKQYRLWNGLPWFESEQPNEEIMDRAEARLSEAGWRVDYVLSHTAPLQFEPRHAFLPGLDQRKVDKTTERWLGSIEKRLTYDRWFCGHYHIDDQEGPIRIVQNDFIELGAEGCWEV